LTTSLMKNSAPLIKGANEEQRITIFGL